jgi:hypothetical protein
VVAISWEALFVYDVMIFCLLFFKSLHTRRDSGLRWAQIPILSLLIRDGGFDVTFCGILFQLTKYRRPRVHLLCVRRPLLLLCWLH